LRFFFILNIGVTADALVITSMLVVASVLWQ
ncbi:hypothetical protein VII00023_09269, partial [Vibrio ichthyoenteri ATCC 700023]